MNAVYILWDDSHLWGLLAWRALAAMGVAVRLVSGREIAGGLLEGDGCAVLLAPGGNAREKAGGLGLKGIRAVRGFVDQGGIYLGFCGGAGLGLADGGLKLCPWKRRPFASRMQHFVSGPMLVSLDQEHELCPRDAPAELPAPVWWPGRFAPKCEGDVRVLGSYLGPGHDIWVADLPLDSLPGDTLDEWERDYGVTLSPVFMRGQPCLVEGASGQGRYILSYAHLETPASPEANGLLAHLLRAAAGVEADGARVPAWDLARVEPAWDDPALLTAREAIEEIVALGHEHHLLFHRTPWLTGWRRGLPGLAINSLRALVHHCLGHAPTDEAKAFWKEREPAFAQRMASFRRELTGYLLAERLDMTLSQDPQSCPLLGLKEQRNRLFGPPPCSGGVYGELKADLEELARLISRKTNF